jgi:hypothetical protein
MPFYLREHIQTALTVWRLYSARAARSLFTSVFHARTAIAAAIEVTEDDVLSV